MSATRTTVPGSPTLDNPDLILPPYRSRRDTPSPPDNAAALQRTASLTGNKRRSLMEKPGLGPRLPVAGVRPTAPGLSWQSESPVGDNGGLTRRVSVRTNTADPAFAKRLSRTPSLRSTRSWQRSPSTDLNDGSRSQSFLSFNAHRPTLAERLNEEDEDEPESPYTTTSESTNADDDDISTKAEEILANAKKRLTAMGGNLSRARSVSLARSGSAASNSPESGRLSRQASKSYAGSQHSWALTSSKLRQASLSGQGGGHLRVASETAAPVQRRTSHRIEQRSVSALGHGSAASSPGLQNEWTDSSSLDSLSNGLPRHLEALPEDELASAYGDSMSRASLLIRQHQNSTSFYQSPASSTSTLSRARSSIALRDLQEGVADLSGKLTHLREATRRESMKRASLQRLKSPSPFTNAQQDWEDSRDRHSKMSSLSTDTAIRVNVTADTPPTIMTEIPSADKDDDEVGHTRAAKFKSPVSQLRSEHGIDHGDSPLLPVHPKIRHIPPTPTTPYKGHNSQPSTDSSHTNTTTDSNPGPISPSLSDAFPAPPDTTPPRSRAGSIARSRSASVNSTAGLLSHEDNPDAFDYSRFLLDSAMGNVKMTRERSPSGSSATTNSTTRPRANSAARLSKASNTSAASRASTIKRISLSPSRNSRGSSGSSGSGQSQPTIAQRRASGRSNSSASMQSITTPDGAGSATDRRPSDASSAATTASPVTSRPDKTRTGHTRQLSTDSASASSVASFATALERASSRLTIRSLSRSTLRNASAGSTSTNGNPVPTHRAGLEAYESNREGTFLASGSEPDDSPQKTRNDKRATLTLGSPGAKSNDPLAEADAALRVPDTPTSESLAANIHKASEAILSAVLAVSHAAVREDDERRGGPDPARVMDAADQEMLGRVLEGVIGAAVGLIGRVGDDDGDKVKVHGQKGNSWRESALPANNEIEVDQSASMQARQIWRMRCEVARRALAEEKPGEGF